MKTSDYLYGTEFEMIQKEDIYHFNSDTTLLGLFADPKHRDYVLDVGCGSGALMLYASRGMPACIHGIDIDESAIEMAKVNLENNHVKGKCFVCNLSAYARNNQDAYTLLLCNPPYFQTEKDELKNDQPARSAARHESSLFDMDTLFQSAKRLLKSNGRLEMVHRASRLNALVIKAHMHGFTLVRMRIAYESAVGYAKTVCLEFRPVLRNSELKIEKPAFLDHRESFMWNEVWQ